MFAVCNLSSLSFFLFLLFICINNSIIFAFTSNSISSTSSITSSTSSSKDVDISHSSCKNQLAGQISPQTSMKMKINDKLLYSTSSNIKYNVRNRSGSRSYLRKVINIVYESNSFN